MADEGAPGFIQPSGRLDLRKCCAKSGCERCSGERGVYLIAAECRIQSHAIDAIGVAVMAIVTQLVTDIKQNEQTTREANGQTGNVDAGIGFLLEQVPDGDFEMVFEHEVLLDMAQRAWRMAHSVTACFTPCAMRLAPCYSYRNASTGFASAALTACVLTVRRAMSNVNAPASAKIHQPMSVR